ncbi:hypothetical protein LINPERHAP2_LOCUS31129 [Linum perenne]
MSSAAAAATQFPDFQFSAEGSEKRKKVDFKPSFESPDSNWRNSLAWDNAFLTSPGMFSFQFTNFPTLHLIYQHFDQKRLPFSGILELDELFETLNLEGGVEHHDNGKKKQQQYDTRRSLAWDSAFLNSAGVLDPEELSIVNRGFRSSDVKVEPDVWRSVESNSTANSDGSSSSLASLEIDLFSDIKGGFSHKSAGFMAVQDGKGGSSSGKPPRMSSSSRGISASSIKNESRRASSLIGSHGGSKGKTRAFKSTPTSKSPSSVLQACTRKASPEFDTKTPPLHSSSSALRTPLKFLAGSKHGPHGSGYASKRASPASSVSDLSFSSELSSRSSSQASESKVLHLLKPGFGSASPRHSSTAPQTMKKSVGGSSPFLAATNPSRKLQASGLRMPSPKLGYFDPENPSGSTPRRGGNLRSKSHGQPRIANASNISAGRTSLGKHQLTGNIAFSLNSIKTGINERWEDCFSNNNMKKKRCMKEDSSGATNGRENCCCNKRPGNNKENNIAAASGSSSSYEVRFSRGFSPVWK